MVLSTDRSHTYTHTHQIRKLLRALYGGIIGKMVLSTDRSHTYTHTSD